ncbi:hypothetical protein BCAR13_620045 [Paraburkholderia caribensis]|nr:hypothetical protein BCAR13_620045 [Paraburkholderia caribensis]
MKRAPSTRLKPSGPQHHIAADLLTAAERIPVRLDIDVEVEHFLSPIQARLFRIRASAGRGHVLSKPVLRVVNIGQRSPRRNLSIGEVGVGKTLIASLNIRIGM